MTTGMFTVGGAVQASAGVYIERKADQDLLALCAAGSFAYVLAPRQIGKSSLMVHTVQRLKQRSVACVTIILTAKDVTADQWYRALLIRIADQLHVPIDLQHWWATHDHLSISQRFMLFLQELPLIVPAQRVVIFIDEIELTLGLPFADDFFGTLRSLYDQRATTPALGRISFVLLGATSPGELVQQPSRAPFNIGQAVAMTDFTFDEAQQFAQVFSAPLEDSKRVLGYILDWTGGHPYLTQCLCAALIEREETWDRAGIARLVQHTFLASSESHNSNLQEVQRTITKRAEDPYATLITYRTILRRGSVLDSAQSPAKAALKLAGVVQAQGDQLVVRNRIYRSVFDQAWVQEQLELLPNYLPRRIQQTFQYAAYMLLLPLLLLAALAGFQWYRAEIAAQQFRAAAAAASSAEIQARVARGLADNASERADAQRKVAQAATLALHAVARFKDDPDFSLKTLLSAVKRGWTSAVDQAMRQIMPPICDDLDRRVYAAAWPIGSNPVVLVDRAAGTRVLSQTLVLLPLPAPAGGQAAFMSDDGSAVLVSNGNGTAQVLDMRANRAIVNLHGPVGALDRAVWSPDRRWIITITKTAAARVWNAATGALLMELTGAGAGATSAAWSADSQRFASASAAGGVRIWTLAATQPPIELITSAHAVTDLAWRSDGAQLAIADTTGTVRILDAHTGVQLLTFRTHDGPVVALRWSHKMAYILSLDSDLTARVWDATSGVRISSLPSKPTQLPFAAAAWSRDDRDILIAGTDGIVCTYATREHMLASERLRNVTPLSVVEENRLFEELLPIPITPTSLQPATPTPVASTAYPPPETNTLLPDTNEPVGAPSEPVGVPSEPVGVPNELVAATDIPPDVIDVPAGGTEAPTAGTIRPTDVTDVPTVGTLRPTDVIDVPTAGKEVPTAGAIRPTDASVLPIVGTEAPTDGAIQPTNVTDAPTVGTDRATVEPAVPTDATTVPTLVAATTAQPADASTSHPSPTPVSAPLAPSSTPAP